MMQLPIAGSLRREFAGRSEAAIYRRFQRRQEEERQRREEREDARTDSAELLDMAALVVTEMEINNFRREIDRYDTATIVALQQNEIDLAEARERLERIFAKAHVLPDGRRVFKTEDGLHVVDEYGQELSPDVISPEEIADARPRWEEASDAIDRLEALTQEREELLDYQAKLDDARKRLDNGDLTREEFDRLRTELQVDMPVSVRAQFPELADEQHADFDQAAQPDAAPIELDLSEDLVPSTAGPKAFVPG